jgi:hypothetical protein
MAEGINGVIGFHETRNQRRRTTGMASKATEARGCRVGMDARGWRLKKATLLGAALAMLAGCGSTTTGSPTQQQQQFDLGCHGKDRDVYCC